MNAHHLGLRRPVRIAIIPVVRPTDRLRAELSSAEGVILLEDLGMSGRELAWARQHMRAEGLPLRSVPTSQLRWALAEGPLGEACTGRILLVLARDAPETAARGVAHLLRGRPRLRLRGCMAHGVLVALDAMTTLPSRVAVQRSLVELLRSRPLSLLEVLDERAAQLGGGDARFSVAELQALRRRLARHLGGPPGDDEHRGRWVVRALDTEAIFAEVPTLRLRSGWRLRGYAFRSGGNGQGFVVALPPALPDPHPLGDAMWRSLFDPPRVPGARPPYEALEGDGSDESYLHASILLRELAEFGALWHGASWGDHTLVDALPPDWPWTCERPLPRSLRPRVVRRGEQVRVVLVSYSYIELVRLVRHVDVYPGEGYRPWLARETLATAGFGAVH